MIKKLIIFIFIILPFFPLHSNAVLAQSNGIDVNLGVEGCNNNGICEPATGETPLSCPVDCAVVVPPTPTTPPPPPPSGGGGGGSRTLREKIIISNISIRPNFTSSVINWNSSVSTISTIKWGETTEVKEGIIHSVDFARIHQMEIINLKPGTLYYFTIESEDPDGNSNTTAPIYFFTKFLIDTTFPLSPRSVITYADISGITISWQNPPDDNFSYVRIMKHPDRFIGDPFSGQLIYQGAQEKFLDTAVMAGKKYFYVLFSRNKNGDFSGGVGASQTAFSPKGTPTPIPPSPPVVSISETFFVHQYGEQVEPLTNLKSITIEGDKSTVVDTKSQTLPDDWMRVTNGSGEVIGQYLFSFSVESGRYQSVIPPLLKAGTYYLEIYRYKNNVRTIISQGKLTITENGTLQIVKPDRINFNNYYLYIIIFFILLLLILMLLIKRRDKRRPMEAR